MNLRHLLLETPQSIEPTEFNLDDPVANKRFARQLMADRRYRPLVQSQGLTLVEVGPQLALMDLQTSTLVYYVRWRELFHKIVGKLAASQLAVWRDPKVGRAAYMAKTIFFDHLLAQYGAVITDALQTPDGQAFWVKRVRDAFDLGLHVYYLNLLPADRTNAKELLKLRDIVEFDQLAGAKAFWGDKSLHQARKIIISQDPL